MKVDYALGLMAADFRHIKDEAELGRRALELLRELFQKIDSARLDENYEQALDAVVHLLRWSTSPEARETTLWFHSLVFAFSDLKYGRLDPILTPQKTGNRPPDSTLTWCCRSDLAFAVKLLATIPDVTRKKATEMIAREFPELRYLAAPGKKLVVSITAWCAEFEKRRIKNRYASRSYERWCELFHDYQFARMAPHAKQDFVRSMLWIAVHRARDVKSRSQSVKKSGRLTPGGY